MFDDKLKLALPQIGKLASLFDNKCQIFCLESYFWTLYVFHYQVQIKYISTKENVTCVDKISGVLSFRHMVF